MGYITIDNTNIRVTSINLDPQLQRITRPIIGAGGSITNYIGSGGKILTLECRANNDEYNDLKELYTKNEKVTLISPSEADYNNDYHIIQFNQTEYRKGHFTISMKLIEDFTYNITRQDFVNYTITAKTVGNEVDVGETWNPS